MPPSTRDDPALGVEGQHAIEAPRVDEDARLAELLATHRMPAARDRHRLPLTPRVSHDRRGLFDITRPDDRLHSRRVQLRVDVVDNRGGDAARDDRECR